MQILKIVHWIYASVMFLLFSEYTVGRIREVHHKTGDTQCVNMPFNQIFKMYLFPLLPTVDHQVPWALIRNCLTHH